MLREIKILLSDRNVTDFMHRLHPGPPPGLSLFDGAGGIISAAVLNDMPEYGDTPVTKSVSPNPFYAVDQGNLMVCLDVQALPAAEQLEIGHFLPQVLTTVIFAVDRTKTDFLPQSWKDLVNTPVMVGVSEKTIQQQLVLASAIQATGNKDSALALLAQVQDSGHFIVTKDNAPIMITLDTIAVQRIHDGEDLTILVPQDGTLSFAMGLLSREPVSGADEDDLLAAGMRLLDGRCESTLYPPSTAYASAHQVTDMDRFLQLTRNARQDLRRTVLDHWMYSISWGRALQLTFAVILIVLWTAAALYRSTRSDIRKWLYLISGLCVGWLMLTIFKYQIPTPSLLNRICWYAFYIFLLGLPLALLGIAAMIDRPFSGRRWPRWIIPFFVLYPALLLMVFTNDFHQFVFRFDRNGNWDEYYTYGPGYLMIFAFCLIVFLFAFVLLARKSWNSPRRYIILEPIVVAMLLLGYNAGYAMGIPLVRQSILSVVFCILAMMFVESLLNSGLIPVNVHYKDLFSKSGLRMHLLDDRGSTALLSENAEALSREQIIRILLSPGEPLRKDPNTLIHSQKIRGGYVVWQEDISLLRELQEQIQRSVTQIEGANNLLSKESYIRRQKLSVQVKSQVFDILEQDIAEKSGLLAQAVRSLPQCEDRDSQLAYIILLLCHIKRRCNLFFLAQQGTQVHSNELSVYLDKLAEFAGLAHIRALIRCSVTGAVDIHIATLCYDFFFTVLSWSVLDSGATLVAQLDQKGGHPCFSILSSESTDSLHFPDSFLRTADALGAALSLKCQDDANSIFLTFSAKREELP